MLSNDDHNFLSVHIHKTGGASIYKTFFYLRIIKKINKHKYNPDIPYTHTHHYTALEWKKDIGEEDFNSRFKFTFVRNPWSKVVSKFTRACQTSEDGLDKSFISSPEAFNKWAKATFTDRLVQKCRREHCDHTRMMYWPCVDWITDEKGKIMVDFIGRYENLEEDYEKVLKIIEDKAGKPIERVKSLMKVNVSNGGFGYRHYYNDESIELVRENFKKDIEEFGYEY